MKIRADFNFLFSLLLIFLMNSFDYALIFLLSAMIHEMGHIFFLKIFGAQKAELSLGLIGAEIKADMSHLSYAKEWVVYMGGAFFNFLFSLACPFILKHFFDERIIFFFLSNLGLALINLLPSESLDGGRALCSFLLIFFDLQSVLRAVFIISALTDLGVGILSVYLTLSQGANLTLLIFSATLIFYFISGKPSCLKAS